MAFLSICEKSTDKLEIFSQIEIIARPQFCHLQINLR